MQRSAFHLEWAAIAIAMCGFALQACADEGVGEPCLPERIPCSETNGCGYDPAESYLESSSVQCRSRLCIVHKLDNGKGTPGDPTDVCKGTAEDGDNCVPEEQLDQSVYCTCRCDGPKTSVEFCECPGGFECQEVLKLGGDGIRGSYCVRPAAAE
jgi:hypothetical protein